MTRDNPPVAYDDDFFAWTQDQAAALRAMPSSAAACVDIANIATEIEDLGRRDLREVISYLALLLEHLIKIEGAPSSRDAPHWRGEAINFQASALQAFSPSMRRALAMDDVYRLTRRRVAAAVASGLDLEMPAHPPFVLDELLEPEFDLDAAVAKLAAYRATRQAQDP